MNVIAIDLGGTRIKLGVIIKDEIVVSRAIPAHREKGLAYHFPSIEREILQMLQEQNANVSDFDGVFFSFPSLVNNITMRVLTVPQGKFEDAPNLDFQTWARDAWNLPFVLEMDSRAALIGEWQYGAGRGCENLVMVTLGTGIGTATMIQGKILHGKHFQAGCLGSHFILNVFNGHPCRCGRRGCGEAEASTWSIHEIAEQDPRYPSSRLSQHDKIDLKCVFETADEGDVLAESLVKRTLDVWAANMISLIHAYDPERLIVGGGVIEGRPAIIEQLAQRIVPHAWTPWGDVRVVKAEHPNSAALLAGNYILQQYITGRYEKIQL